MSFISFLFFLTSGFLVEYNFLISIDLLISSQGIVMDFRSLSRWFILIGASMLIIGGLFWPFSRLFSRELPGTIKIQAGNLTIFFPILLSIILSLVLTLVLNLIGRFLQR